MNGERAAASPEQMYCVVPQPRGRRMGQPDCFSRHDFRFAMMAIALLKI